MRTKNKIKEGLFIHNKQLDNREKSRRNVRKINNAGKSSSFEIEEQLHIPSPVEREEPNESVIMDGYYTGKVKYGYAEQEGDESGPFTGREEEFIRELGKKKRNEKNIQ
jgi:hypothetical protein